MRARNVTKKIKDMQTFDSDTKLINGLLDVIEEKNKRIKELEGLLNDKNRTAELQDGGKVL